MSSAKEIYDRVNKAHDLAKMGFSGGVEKACADAEIHANQVLQGDELNQALAYIGSHKTDYLAIAKSIERDREIISQFSRRRPNSRESFLAAELGYSPFPQPTEEQIRQMCNAHRRLQEKGIWVDNPLFQ